MKVRLLLILSLVLVVRAFAQNPSPTPLPYSEKTVADMRRIQTAALASDYAYKQTGYLSNNIGARLSGSPQAERAVQYVAEQMRKLGLEVRLQPCMVPHWIRGEERAELIEWEGMAAGTTQKVVLTALGGSVATPATGLTAEIIVVKDFNELSSLGREKVAGKIVMFNYKFDRELQASGLGGAAYGQAVGYRFAGAMAAARLGAVAVLVRSAGGSQNRLAHTGLMGYTDGVTKIPAAAIPYEDAEKIAWLAAMGKVRIKMTLTPQTLPDAQSFNVIADLKGSEKPDEIIIVSGHLDSWDLGDGSLDNGAGVAVSMAVPAILKQLNLKPKRTIRFIAWMNEENGSRGSAAYSEAEKNNIANHFAALESDFGASHPLGIVFAGKSDALPFLQPISGVLAGQGAAQIQQQPGIGADTAPLTRAGVPSFAPFFNQQTYFNYHHSAADTFDKVDPKNIAEVSSVMAVLAYGLANLEQPLPR